MNKTLLACFSALTGIVLGVILMAIQGVLGIQKVGMRAGVFLDPWTNSVASVTGPRQPLLSMVGMGILGALVALALVFGVGWRRGLFRTLFVAGFLVATLLLALWGLLTAPLLGEVDVLQDGLSSGPAGWVQMASMEGTVHLLIFLAVAVLIMGGRRSASDDRRGRSSLPVA